MRKIEVFSAGCLLCQDAVALVKELACPDCEVAVHDLRSQEGLRRAGEYGIASVPTMVIDGQVTPCCARGRPDAEQLKAMGLGTPLA